MLMTRTTRNVLSANMQLLIVHDIRATNVGNLTRVVFNIRAIYFYNYVYYSQRVIVFKVNKSYYKLN